MNNSFMDKLRSFLGFRQDQPVNDFRNPIWGSDDDDDDGDELYNRQPSTIYTDPMDVHRQFTEQMHKMFEVFGSMFGDMKTLLHDDSTFDSFTRITEIPSESEDFKSHNNIRDYYLKPGYHNHKQEHLKEDEDFDGKISSNEISGLLKQKDEGTITPFSGNLIPGKSYCQTVITTSITKPDGTIETRRIVQNGHEVIEDTVTSSGPESLSLFSSGLDPISSTGIVFHSLSELMAFFRNFN